MTAPTVPLPALDPLDFLAVDSLLDEEERTIRDTVRQFVRERVLPEVGDWFERGVLPREVIAELGKLGLFGMHLDGYGLPGASAVAYGLTCLELEAGDSGVRSAVSVQGSLAMFAIWRWGSEEQKERWLPKMATGELLGCFGLTEPDAGSDPGTMRTQARRDGSEWVLNGAKMWITNGSIADLAVVWARTEDDEIRGFVVERGMPGFTAPDIHKKMSLRASVTSELVLDDVRLPAENMLPGASKPGMSFSTRKPLILPSSVRAQTTATSEIEPFVIHIFVPFRIQSLPSRRACVRIAPGSEPASGSVRPKQPITSPACIRGNHCSFCSSEPQRQMANIASDPCTETALRMPESPASSSRHVRPYATALAPGRPYPCRCMPKRPSFASSEITSRGKIPCSNQSPTSGSTRSRTNWRTVSRTAFSSSSRRASIARKSRGSSAGGAAVVAMRGTSGVEIVRGTYLERP